MFGIGTTEILIILIIALLVLGPKEIPKVARTVGRGLRELQRAKDELRQTIDMEIEEEENRKPRVIKTREKIPTTGESLTEDEETKKETVS